MSLCLTDPINSQREPSIKEDENDIAQSIHKKRNQPANSNVLFLCVILTRLYIVQEDQGSEVAFRFGHLYNKLASRVSKRQSTILNVNLTTIYLATCK